jgi:hypothetical protein
MDKLVAATVDERAARHPAGGHDLFAAAADDRADGAAIDILVAADGRAARHPAGR